MFGGAVGPETIPFVHGMIVKGGKDGWESPTSGTGSGNTDTPPNASETMWQSQENRIMSTSLVKSNI